MHSLRVARNWFWRPIVTALDTMSLGLLGIEIEMSAIRDAAVEVKNSVDTLADAVDAVVAAYQAGNPADLAEAFAALAEAKADAVESTQNISDILVSPTPLPEPTPEPPSEPPFEEPV